MDKKREQLYVATMLHGIEKFVGHHSDDISAKSVRSKEEIQGFDDIISQAYLWASATNLDNINKGGNRHLVPITATIDNGKDAEKWYQPLSILSLDKSYFPQTTANKDNVTLENLWKSFIEDAIEIKASTNKAYAETLLSLLYKYGSCIPSSVAGLEDVSLYDNVRVASALAVCLYDVQQSGENPKNPFLLIGADLSGIQPYIYTIVSKYAGINLKGRSYYIRLLTDAVVRYILKELDLFQANIVYNAGGGFYLIAPNTKKVSEALKSIIEKIEEKMFAAHGTSLFLAIDSIELSSDSLLGKSDKHLGTLWGELFDKKEQKKNARCKDLLSRNYDKFFNPSQKGGDEKVDIITGEYFAEGEKRLREGNLFPIRQVTKDQIELGKALQQFEMIVVSECELPPLKEKINVEPIGLGIHYYFIKAEDWKKSKDALKGYSEKIEVVTLNGKDNRCDFFGLEGSIGNSCKFDFYGGNGFKKKFDNKFDSLCKAGLEDSFKRLGILRMDVDNLGHIFQQGISPNRLTLSRMAALSRSFDYFFSGYLNTIWRAEDPDYSLIIYSGGDDLFIIGSWDVTIKMAEQIHKDFREFTCNNPAFSISGGIAIVEGKFPIIKAAQMSADEESAAKSHVCNGISKNSISFLDMAMNFDKEYPQVKALKSDIVKLCESSVLPKSFIGKVLQHWGNADLKGHKICNVKTYWMMTYDLSRMKQRMQGSEAKSLVDNCKTEICGDKPLLNGRSINSNYHALELWALACRWAELELRTKE